MYIVGWGMASLKKSTVFILMTLCWLYSMSGLLIGISIYFGILLQIFIPTLSVLEAVIGLIKTLGDEGLVGLLAGIWLVGQFFLSYKLYGSLKNKYESLYSSLNQFYFVSTIQIIYNSI